MVAPFDIFYLRADGQEVWQNTVATLEIARLQIRTLMAIEPGDYAIRSRQTGHKMMIKADGSIGPFVGQTIG